MFMCEVCHKLHGSGFENSVVYEKAQGKYYEVKKQMKAEQLQKTIAGFAAKAHPDTEGTIVLLGEIGLQLTILNETIKEVTASMMKILKMIEEVKDVGEDNQVL